jgi:hypothetical protein
VLPSRIDQLVLFKSVKSEFKDAYYWSGEQRAADVGYAWGQGFGYGYQGFSQRQRSVPCPRGPQDSHFGNSVIQ